MQTTAERTALLSAVPSQLLKDTVQKALQVTKASGAAIALEHQGELICRASEGESVPEVGTAINAESGLTGICLSSQSMQLCSNTELDSRVDADACREIGVRAIVIAPLLQKEQLLGVLEVFSRRPYAFGIRDLQALQDVSDQFATELSAVAAGQNPEYKLFGVRGSVNQPGERKSARFLMLRKIGLLAGLFVLVASIGFYWGRGPSASATGSSRGQVTLLATVPQIPRRFSPSSIEQGQLIHRVNPAYPEEAIKHHLEGQVVVQVHIAQDGSVYGMEALRGDNALAQAAIEAVRQWRFSPYKLNGRILDLPVVISFSFSIPQ
jgi:TonB family protein